MIIYHNIAIKDGLGAVCRKVPHSRESKETAVGFREKCSFGQLREATQKGDLVLTSRLVVVLGENHLAFDVHIRLLSPPNHIAKDHDETCI